MCTGPLETDIKLRTLKMSKSILAQKIKNAKHYTIRHDQKKYIRKQRILMDHKTY